MKRYALILVIGLFVAWGSISAPIAPPAQAAVVESVICCNEGGYSLPACSWAAYTAWQVAWGYKDGRTGWWRCIPVGNYSGYWAPIVGP